MTNIINKIVYYLDMFLPKFNWVIIQTYPDYEDNGLALYEEIKDLDFNKIIWLTNNNHIDVFYSVNDNTVHVKRRSFKGLVYFLFSKYVFFTHGTYIKTYPKNQISINIWHGFGFKAVGLLNDTEGTKSTYVIATSKFSSYFMAQQMGVPQKNVLITGYPRNDRLLKAFENKKEIKKKLDISENKKVLFWLPTYRNSVEGDLRKDGVQYDNPFNLESFDVNIFNAFLEKNNLVCLFKPHPMAFKMTNYGSNNFFYIDDSFFVNKKLTLYQLLGIVDILISDISSVITDFLLINKPIIHAFSDIKEYFSTRNILLNPPQDYFVGPLVETQKQLEDVIIKILNGNDEYETQRMKMKVLFHDNNLDCKSTQRIINLINV